MVDAIQDAMGALAAAISRSGTVRQGASVTDRDSGVRVERRPPLALRKS